jgi:uncharacterized protein (DUF1330 family)
MDAFVKSAQEGSEMSVTPSEQQIRALTEEGPDGPVVMVNLLKFRLRAEYERERPEASLGLSGADAYQRYGAVAQKCVAEAGGSIAWAGQQALVLIGGAEQEWDQVICVRYPSRQAFLRMVSQPHYLAATYHRTAGLERTALLCCAAGTAS